MLLSARCLCLILSLLPVFQSSSEKYRQRRRYLLLEVFVKIVVEIDHDELVLVEEILFVFRAEPAVQLLLEPLNEASHVS